VILKSHYLNSSLVGKRCPPLRARLSGSPDRTAASPGSSDNRLRFAFARGALAAEIDVQGRRPESPWAGLADRTRRVTRAVSGAGPPRHRHIAAVDRIEPPLGPAPVNAVGAKGADREPGSIIIGAPTIKIAGVMEGYFGDLTPITMVQPASSNNQMIPVSTQNAGIAVVIPAQKVRDILNSPVLVGKRH